MVGAEIERTELQALQASLGELSEQARQFVQAAALLGDTFVLQDVARVQSVTTLSLLPALDEALKASLIRFHQDHLAFRSSRVRRAVGESIPGPVRRMLLRGTAAALPQQRGPESAETLTKEPSPSPSPVREFRESTELREPRELGEFDELHGPSESHGVAEHMMASLFMAQSSLARPLSARATRALRTALVDAVGGPDAGAEADRVLGLFRHDEQCQRDRARAVLAHRASGPAAVAAAVVLSNLEWAAGQLTEGLRWAREALRMADDRLPEAWRPYPALALTLHLIHLGDLSEGGAQLARIREEVQRLGHGRAIADAMVVHGRLLVAEGRTSDADAELMAGVSLADRIGAHTTVAQGVSLRAVIALGRGDVEVAAGQVWQARRENAAESAVFPSVRQTWADFLVASAQMDPRSAVYLFAGSHAELLTKPLLFLRDNGAAARLVRLARAAGEFSVAATVVRTVEWLAARNTRQPAVAATAEHARGVLHDDADALRYAAREHRGPWAAAAAAEDLGMLLLRQEQSAALVEHQLRTARDRWADLGAQAEAARVEGRLRELGGVRAVRTNPAPQTAPAPQTTPVPQAPPAESAALLASLTEAERRIAVLVAEGLTNQQVARWISRSPHTVNYHLRQIFRKLNVGSRVELARRLHALRSTAPDEPSDRPSLVPWSP